MKILHLLSAGNIGGIEVLCREIAQQDKEEKKAENVFAFLFAGGPIEEQMRQMEAPTYGVYEIPKWNVLGKIRYLRQICQKEEIQVVVVHNEGISTLVYYCLLARMEKGKMRFLRYLHSVYEIEYSKNKNRLLTWLETRMIQRCLDDSDKVVAVSQCVKDSFVQFFHVSKEKIVVIYNGIRGLPELTNPDDNTETITMLYVGRLVHVKGIDVLLDAFAKVVQSQPKIILKIVGDGPDRERYEEQVRQLGIRERVSFEGFQTDTEPYFRQADIFIYPSRWQEAFGISIVEAMSYGLLCIASQVGGIPEIITEGSGYLFENENSVSLAQRLEQATELIRQGKSDTMKTMARKRASDFLLENTIQSLHNLYGTLKK